MNNKINLNRIILVAAFSCFSTFIFAAPLQILELKKGQLSQVEQMQICEQLKYLCQQPAQWRSLKIADQNLWLLSGSDIAQFRWTEINSSMAYEINAL